MKLVKLFAPLIVATLLLSACGDSSVTRQDVIDFVVDTIQEEEPMAAEISREAMAEVQGCLLDEIKAVSGDSYETILDESKKVAEDDSYESKYEDISDEAASGCMADSREVLEFSINVFLPEDMQVDLSGVDNYHREALAVMFNWSMSMFIPEEMSDDAGYCMADYVADNSGDSHRDILIDLLDDGSAYEAVSEAAVMDCLDF
tara:strand:- start:4635 stop:5243 length:609 start_codon:yes stop_codon:yes gene_type:complete